MVRHNIDTVMEPTVMPYVSPPIQPITKVCTKCGERQPLANFYIKRTRPDGGKTYFGYCKKCAAAAGKRQYEATKPIVLARQAKRRTEKASEIQRYVRDYYQKNRDAIIEKTSAYQARPDRKEADKERQKKNYLENRESIRGKQRLRNATPEGRKKQRQLYERHYSANKIRFIVRGAERRAARIQATPKWYKRSDAIPFFEEAKRLTEETGVPHVVDHIIPLRGKKVCGLHVKENFRVITAAANWSKFNHFDEDVSEDH